MRAMQLGTIKMISAVLPQKRLAAAASTAPESFGSSWRREIGVGESVGSKQSRVAGSGRLTGYMGENVVPRTAGSEQKATGGESASSGEEAACKAEAEEVTGRDATENLVLAAARDERRVDAGMRMRAEASAPAGFDKQAAGLKARHGVAAPGFVEASEGRKANVEMLSPELGNAAVIKESESAAALVAQGQVQGDLRAEPASRPVELEGSRAASLQVKKAASSQRSAGAMPQEWPAVTREIAKGAAVRIGRAADEKVAVEAVKAVVAASVGSAEKREGAQTNAVGPIGVPGGHANAEVNASGNQGLPLNVAGALSVAVRPVAVGHSATVSTLAGVQLDVTSLIEGEAGEAPRVLVSGPVRLDVGVFDGTHGWLRVRAELGAGGAVSAALTANAGAHESLRTALPEMAKYLQSEAVSVHRITLERAAAGVDAMADGRQHGGNGAAGGQAQDGGGLLKRKQREMSERAAGPGSRNPIDAESEGAAQGRGWVPYAVPGLGIFEGSGGWLNVCA